MASWEEHLSKRLREYMDSSTIEAIKALEASSLFMTDLSQDTGKESMLNVLRDVKVSGNAEHAETLLAKPGAVIGGASLDEEFWLRYELSLLCASNNRIQEAINLALTLWHFANRDDRSIATLPRLLGLIAWGTAQYRLGNTVEGIVCILASIRLSVELGEVGPLVEDGIRILQLWVNNCAVFSDQERNEFDQAIAGLSTGDEERKNIISLLARRQWQDLYGVLKCSVYSNDHGRDWVLDLFHYTQACGQTDREKEAYALILRHGREAIKILESRRDARASVLYVWAQTLVYALPHTSGDETARALRMADDLLEIGISDLEKERQAFFHGDERARIVDRSREMYKMYLFTQVVRRITEGMESPPESKILNIFDLLSFRSIEERKASRFVPTKGLQAVAKPPLACKRAI